MRADPTSKPYILPPLSDDDSLRLLQKKAFPNRDANEQCTTDLLDIAKQFTKKSDGSPLALVVLDSRLSCKPETSNAWKKVLETLDWDRDCKKLMDTLAISYDALPAHLKMCFTYFACFPEKYEINAKVLLRLWVAEGFIRQIRSKTMEDTAKRYLAAFEERFLVIVVQRNNDNSIKTIRLSATLHYLAIKKAKENDLVSIFSNKDVNIYLRAPVSRRVALQISDGNEINLQLSELVPPNLVSLRYFGEQLPDCSGYEMLKVLNVERSMGFHHEMKWEKLTELRLLRVVRNSSFALSIDSLIQQVDKLTNLQTLDLSASDVFEEFPENVWGIETLRHVLLPPGNIIPGPPSWAKLKCLQTLKYVQDSVSWQPTELPQMPDVRHLKLRVFVLSFSLETIASLLQTLKKLISLRLDLSLNNNDVYSGIIDLQAFPFFRQLESLCLSCLWPESLTLRSSVFPPHLLKLQLNYSFLEKDPMPELGKLPQLRKLSLHAAYTGEKMTCSEGGFPRLELLTLSGFSNLEELEIKERAMPALQLLKIVRCCKLKSQPEHPTCPTCRIELE